MNPCHTCPTLELDGSDGAIWESSAIMRYLCLTSEGGEKYYPADPVLRAKIDMVMDWRQTSMYKSIAPVGYVIFGIDMGEEATKKGFKELMEDHFPILLDTYLKDTPFCYSETVTIADLAVALTFTFLKCRKNLWAEVPEKVKEYHARVLESFPDTKDMFDMLDGMCTGYSGDGADITP